MIKKKNPATRNTSPQPHSKSSKVSIVSIVSKVPKVSPWVQAAKLPVLTVYRVGCADSCSNLIGQPLYNAPPTAL
jgi:hypothetical protein